MGRSWTMMIAATVSVMSFGCANWDVPDWPQLPPGMCFVPDNYDGKNPDRMKFGPCEDGGDAGSTMDAAGSEDAGGFDGNADIGVDESDVDARSASDAIVGRDVDGSMDASEAGVGDAVLDSADAAIGDGGSDRDGMPCDVSRSPVDTPCLIDEQFGVFLSPKGNDNGTGTRAAPYKTLGRALGVASSSGKRLYACDDGTGYPDAIGLDAALDGTRLYGGFECVGWTYATARRAKVNPATGPALTVTGVASGVTVEDFEFAAADVTGTAASSIAAIVDTTRNVTLRRVRLVAGIGAAGQAGADGAKGDDGLAVDVGQRGGKASCPGLVLLAGGSWSSASSCGSRGGPGGAAYQGANGGNGIAGTPNTHVDPAGIDNGGPRGMPGGAGSPGVVGTPGQQVLTMGTFGASGYTSAPAAGSGTDGNTAQGGGGGGASDGLGMCTGASGGAGGMGGCGGKGGTGGTGGGASVALLSWNSVGLVLDSCVLIASTGGPGGKGGNGGLGGLGQDGADGGADYRSGDAGVGDAGSSDAGPTTIASGGKGGRGGNGGNGGPGAGGNGGPSYAVVYKGTSPSRLNGTTVTAGTAGAKGVGGTAGNLKAPDGFVGSAAEEFAAP